MLNGARRLKQSDLRSSRDSVEFSYLPELGATTVDQEVFRLAYHCHTPLDNGYKISTRKRKIFLMMLKEQMLSEKREMEKAKSRSK